MASNRIIDLIVALKHKCSIREEDIQKEYDLSQAEYHGVVVVESDEKLTCSEFSERLELSPSRGSRIIGKMMEKGFINYDSIPGDRRAHSISLTPKGKRVKAKVEQKKDECEKTIREHYSDKKADELKITLTRLLEAL